MASLQRGMFKLSAVLSELMVKLFAKEIFSRHLLLKEDL